MNWSARLHQSFRGRRFGGDGVSVEAHLRVKNSARLSSTYGLCAQQ
jgi:hypothetical protein